MWEELLPGREYAVDVIVRHGSCKIVSTFVRVFRDKYDTGDSIYLLEAEPPPGLQERCDELTACLPLPDGTHHVEWRGDEVFRLVEVNMGRHGLLTQELVGLNLQAPVVGFYVLRHGETASPLCEVVYQNPLDQGEYPHYSAYGMFTASPLPESLFLLLPHIS
eukprot:TRINITY_DN31195_c0_g1_i1.p2 TRINITY_DN31195_c0_g1~~TRINITY_DN31195_c0_g1_i1.p2  ORF type:complete len:163 (+),score=22.81 TRINITY_DN31195_c0_g1_i1:326-814(+)